MSCLLTPLCLQAVCLSVVQVNSRHTSFRILLSHDSVLLDKTTHLSLHPSFLTPAQETSQLNCLHRRRLTHAAQGKVHLCRHKWRKGRELCSKRLPRDKELCSKRLRRDRRGCLASQDSCKLQRQPCSTWNSSSLLSRSVIVYQLLIPFSMSCQLRAWVAPRLFQICESNHDVLSASCVALTAIFFLLHALANADDVLIAPSAHPVCRSRPVQQNVQTHTSYPAASPLLTAR